MKSKHTQEDPAFTPTVRDLLECPNCGRKTLSYRATETEFIYECLSPSCTYWSCKPRMEQGHSLSLVLSVVSVFFILILACYGG